MENTPHVSRLHIALIGLRNAGKSSLLNAWLGQDVSIVSSVAGTTTDAVRKAAELPGLGACVIIDTPGFDDTDQQLGHLRVGKMQTAVKQADIVIMVAGGPVLTPEEREWADWLKLKKTPKDEIDRKVKEAAEILDITQYLDRKPKALSGGQRQRVAIGRAIVRNPAVFLMDEPLSNLDAKLRNQMRAEIIKLRQRINTTFVYVTHDQTEAMTLGDRIVIMRDGFIQQIGTPQEVFNHPANLFVAGFIGTPQMNFFDAKLDKDADGYYVELDGARVHLPEEKQQALRANNVEPQDITLGIRPEHIMLCSDDAAAHISATVDVSEMMGSSVHLHVNANGKDVVVIIPTIDLDGSAQQMFSYGSKVNFTFGGNVLHMFSKEKVM